MFRPQSDEEKRRAVESVYQSNAGRFPDVPNISVAETQRLVSEGGVVIVDVRSPKEQAVSMIEGAITAEHFDDRQGEYDGRTVVSYCTVGYRAAVFARNLRQDGWNAFNLEGSILGWAHGGGALASDNGPTNKVHVYNRTLQLLPEGYEAVW
jgi:rhodanese-related sulfurtransferase